MDVIIDANLLIGLVTQHPNRLAIYQQFNLWADQGTMLHAPDLAYSEVMNALTRMITAGLFSRERVQSVCEELTQLPIQYHTVGFDLEVIEIALKLGRKSAYDAVYLVLGQRLGADLWTMDSPLYRNAIGHGYPVHLLENSRQV
jgi:predicted nucleic acid-binding protein